MPQSYHNPHEQDLQKQFDTIDRELAAAGLAQLAERALSSHTDVPAATKRKADGHSLPKPKKQRKSSSDFHPVARSISTTRGKAEHNLDEQLLKLIEGKKDSSPLKLLEEGANPNALVPGHDINVLEYAAIFKRSLILKTLLHKGAEVRNALYYTAQTGAVNCIRFLFLHGADINQAFFDEQTTALIEASKHGQAFAVKILLRDHHADITKTNKRGQTAYDLATVECKKELLQEEAAQSAPAAITTPSPSSTAADAALAAAEASKPSSAPRPLPLFSGNIPKAAFLLQQIGDGSGHETSHTSSATLPSAHSTSAQVRVSSRSRDTSKTRAIGGAAGNCRN